MFRSSFFFILWTSKYQKCFNLWASRWAPVCKKVYYAFLRTIKTYKKRFHGGFLVFLFFVWLLCCSKAQICLSHVGRHFVENVFLKIRFVTIKKKTCRATLCILKLFLQILNMKFSYYPDTTLGATVKNLYLFIDPVGEIF